ncbi:proline racemase family protein [Serinicoccus kebangsaanensis]|uniref:proline racemase family protein n=1 Tax=Serinicoccus kebangsaanensis TaxID=2602069 RepID=UPI00124D9FA7|nr:proline racemase family protein [Serinicoccus kebangsaanensis]
MESITTEDWHTAGEPFRIATTVTTQGSTVAERRIKAMSGEPDTVRRFLCLEPRGHDDMYGGFITPPDDEGADFGVLFWHKDGFSTACGHGTMALGAWAVATGRVPAPDHGEAVVTIDVPSGRVQARVQRENGRTVGVIFGSVASRVLETGIPVEATRGHVTVDLIYGGAVYATLRANDVGLTVQPENTTELIRLGREVKWALNDHPAARLNDHRLSGVYGTILVDDLGRTDTGPWQRNVTIFADGQVDRSPCGSGTAARTALLAETGQLGQGDWLTHDSIIGTKFLSRVVDHSADGVVPEVTGTAFAVGTTTFTATEGDPLPLGFSLR